MIAVFPARISLSPASFAAPIARSHTRSRISGETVGLKMARIASTGSASVLMTLVFLTRAKRWPASAVKNAWTFASQAGGFFSLAWLVASALTRASTAFSVVAAFNASANAPAFGGLT